MNRVCQRTCCYSAPSCRREGEQSKEKAPHILSYSAVYSTWKMKIVQLLKKFPDCEKFLINFWQETNK